MNAIGCNVNGNYSFLGHLHNLQESKQKENWFIFTYFGKYIQNSFKRKIKFRGAKHIENICDQRKKKKYRRISLEISS